MDEDLKGLADAALLLERAESDAATGAYQGVQESVDRIDALLARLRDRWPAMGAAERRIIGPVARSVRERRDAVAARVPRHRALAVVPGDADPEDEQDPEAAAA
jgi:predicted phage gp36 major capsid-like protein